jgi:hypothetical protein
MSYHAGDLTLVTQAMLVEDWDPTPDELPLKGTDSRDGDSVPTPFVRLPHSCDHWVIGGATEVRMMIADLEAALVALKVST